MDLQSIRQIIELMKENDLAEFELQEDAFRIAVKRGGHAEPNPVMAQPPVLPSGAAAAVLPAGSVPAAADEDLYEGLNPINSPMVGTFYRSPSPDADAFVSVGDEVDEDTVVCIIEAMKVMNEIKAETRGVVRKVLVENATPVQYGQALFVIEPA
jgi:acetyl-CoA carboxylase biotin carboxyl carrier protein